MESTSARVTLGYMVRFNTRVADKLLTGFNLTDVLLI